MKPLHRIQSLFLVLTLAVACSYSFAQNPKNIVILATGGTIAGAGARVHSRVIPLAQLASTPW